MNSILLNDLSLFAIRNNKRVSDQADDASDDEIINSINLSGSNSHYLENLDDDQLDEFGELEVSMKDVLSDEIQLTGTNALVLDRYQRRQFEPEEGILVLKPDAVSKFKQLNGIQLSDGDAPKFMWSKVIQWIGKFIGTIIAWETIFAGVRYLFYKGSRSKNKVIRGLCSNILFYLGDKEDYVKQLEASLGKVAKEYFEPDFLAIKDMGLVTTGYDQIYLITVSRTRLPGDKTTELVQQIILAVRGEIVFYTNQHLNRNLSGKKLVSDTDGFVTILKNLGLILNPTHRPSTVHFWQQSFLVVEDKIDINSYCRTFLGLERIIGTSDRLITIVETGGRSEFDRYYKLGVSLGQFDPSIENIRLTSPLVNMSKSRV